MPPSKLLYSVVASTVLFTPGNAKSTEDNSLTVHYKRDTNSNIDMGTKVLAGIMKIQGFSALEPNWDGYGAMRLSDAVIKRALEFYGQLNFIPRTFPTPRNSIQFEFENDSIYIEIEVFENETALLTVTGGEEQERTIESASEINDIINQFHEPGFSRKSRAFIPWNSSSTSRTTT